VGGEWVCRVGRALAIDHRDKGPVSEAWRGEPFPAVIAVDPRSLASEVFRRMACLARVEAVRWDVRGRDARRSGLEVQGTSVTRAVVAGPHARDVAPAAKTCGRSDERPSDGSLWGVQRWSSALGGVRLVTATDASRQCDIRPNTDPASEPTTSCRCTRVALPLLAQMARRAGRPRGGWLELLLRERAAHEPRQASRSPEIPCGSCPGNMREVTDAREEVRDD
jgi:hypothetical protein